MSNVQELFEKATSQLVELKDTSELMIDLAYSALLLKNVYLAEEVQLLQSRVMQLNIDFQSLLLSCQLQREDTTGLIGVIRMGMAAEKIADAASEISEVVLRGIEPHPILRMMIQDADETVERVEVPKGSPVAGKTLKETQIPQETGIWILTIKRGENWIRPKPSTILEVGDLLIVSGYAEGEEDFKRLISGSDDILD